MRLYVIYDLYVIVKNKELLIFYCDVKHIVSTVVEFTETHFNEIEISKLNFLQQSAIMTIIGDYVYWNIGL